MALLQFLSLQNVHHYTEGEAVRVNVNGTQVYSNVVCDLRDYIYLTQLCV